jgi:iron(III) transport system permease protein
MGESPLVLSLSLVMLVVAYVIRFTATGYNSIEAGFDKVGLKYMEASRMLGMGITKTFFKVDLPLIKGAVFSGMILTFVEIVKELPLALLLRPFNFETLATKTYQYANDEKIFQAAVPSLMIIGVSMISVLIFHQLTKKVER